MADRVEAFAVTVPAGTTAASPHTADLTFPPGEVVEVEIVVPAGHAGLTTLALLQGGGQVIPTGAGQTIVADDDVIHWPWTDVLGNGAWSAQASNIDVFPHTFYVRFLVVQSGQTIPPPILLSPIG